MPEFDLIVISGLEWDSDMAPWNAPAISRDDIPCTGGADKYLAIMKKIIDKVEESKPSPLWRGLGGYSLAGLFAIYSFYQSDLFSRAASASGSLWFPGFLDYIKTHDFIKKPDILSLSLGDKECKARNKALKCVEKNTLDALDYYKNLGLNCQFQMEVGNHFSDCTGRLARAISKLFF